MSLFFFLTIIQGFVAAALVGLVLMQRSEGGGLGIGGGGSPGGMLSARGAADFLSRATKWTAITFVALAIVLAGLAVDVSGGSALDDSLDRSVTQSNDQAGMPAGQPPETPSEPLPEDAPANPLSGIGE